MCTNAVARPRALFDKFKRHDRYAYTVGIRNPKAPIRQADNPGCPTAWPRLGSFTAWSITTLRGLKYSALVHVSGTSRRCAVPSGEPKRGHTASSAQPVEHHDEVARHEQQGACDDVRREACLLALGISEPLAHVGHLRVPAGRTKALCRLLRLFGGRCSVQLLVVQRTLCWVLEDLEGLRDLLEFRLCLLAGRSLVSIRMPLTSLRERDSTRQMTARLCYAVASSQAVCPHQLLVHRLQGFTIHITANPEDIVRRSRRDCLDAERTKPAEDCCAI